MKHISCFVMNAAGHAATHDHDHHAHGHGHHHHHHGGGTKDARKALLLTLLLNGAFLVVELAVGLATNSLALLSDAVHMLGDVGALGLALAAAQLARRPADDRMTFGLVRAETLGAFINGLAMVGACAYIVYEAVERASAGPPEVPGMPILIVGAIGLAINLASAWVLWRSHRDSLNVRGALIHMVGDALGSVGAVVAALFVMAGQPIADPIASLVIVALVGWGTWAILRDSGRVLLQLPPSGMAVDRLRETLHAVPGVAGLHDLHVWTLDGVNVILTAHLVAADGADPKVVRRQAAEALHEHHGIDHATLQVEDGPPGDVPCEMSDCGAAPVKSARGAE